MKKRDDIMPQAPSQENRQPTPEEIHGILTELVAAHGNGELGRCITEYADKFDRISILTQRLPEIDPETREEEFNAAVQEIMQATQDYYAYIAALPQDIRRFLLIVADAKGVNDGTFEEINALLGSEARLGVPMTFAVQAIRPGSYIMQIDAISNQLATLGGEKQIQVGKRGGQPVTTTVTLDMPEHMKIEDGHALSTYDKSIINGVTSLLESGNTVFSIPMLYHAMTGKQNPTVDEQLYEEIAGKLEKMRRMILTIDLTGENEAKYITGAEGEQLRLEDLSLEGYLLPLNKISGVINGKRTELFQIIQQPPLYSYSKMRRQLASVKISLLNAPVNNNSTTIPLKTYLLQRVEMMKNKNNSIASRVILYESVYQELGAADAGKTRRMRIRSYTTTILDYLVEQGYIQGYSEFKKGRSIAGVSVCLLPEGE